MDFFAAQAAARRRRRAFKAAFAAVVLLVAVVPLTLAFLPVEPLWWFAFGALWAGSMLLPAWRTSRRLDQGGMAVAQMVGAHAVLPDARDLPRQRLYNIVEEMSLASGMPVPYVYLLPEEGAINAMAAGNDIDDAAVFVSRGALERLDREQMQALVAHEFSHIQNGDMATNTRMVAWLAGLTGLHSTGRWLLEPELFRADRPVWTSAWILDRDWVGSAFGSLMIALLAVPMIVAGSVGRSFASLLQAAACRQHERMADASAVQFTRNPDALKRTLLAAAAGVRAAPTGGARARAVFAHLWFVQTGKRWLRTHPTIEERIRAIDPRFRMESLAAEIDRAWEAGERQRIAHLAADGARSGVADGKTALLEMLPYLALPAAPEFVVRKVGHPDAADLDRGEALRAALPEAVTRGASSPGQARALILAMLAGGDEARWQRQMAVVRRELGEPLALEAGSMRQAARALELYLRLPAVEVLAPALRGLAPAAQHSLLVALEAMEREDGRSEIFETCLNLLVRHGLADDGPVAGAGRAGSLWNSGEALRTVLSIVARYGAPDEAAARDAYRAGAESIGGGAAPTMALPPNWSVAFDAALEKLARLDPVSKRRVVAALTAAIAHDGRLTLDEAELLRTLCAILRCPLPPLMPEVVAAPSAPPAAPPAS